MAVATPLSGVGVGALPGDGCRGTPVVPRQVGDGAGWGRGRTAGAALRRGARTGCPRPGRAGAPDRAGVDLELAELAGRPAGVAGDGQPQVPLAGRREGHGDRVAAGRVEGVAGGRLQGAERRAVGGAEHRQRLRTRLPGRRRWELQHDPGHRPVGAQVHGQRLREGVVGALPVGVRVAVDRVGGGVHVGVAGLGDRPSGRQVAAGRRGRGGGVVGGAVVAVAWWAAGWSGCRRTPRPRKLRRRPAGVAGDGHPEVAAVAGGQPDRHGVARSRGRRPDRRTTPGWCTTSRRWSRGRTGSGCVAPSRLGSLSTSRSTDRAAPRSTVTDCGKALLALSQ